MKSSEADSVVQGDTDIFIYPGYEWPVDALITTSIYPNYPIDAGTAFAASNHAGLPHGS